MSGFETELLITMSKLALLENEHADIEFREKERDYLLNKDTPFMKEDIEQVFGTHRNYVQCLLRKHHPLHEIAMRIRNNRFQHYNSDPERDQYIDLLRDTSDKYLRARYE